MGHVLSLFSKKIEDLWTTEVKTVTLLVTPKVLPRSRLPEWPFQHSSPASHMNEGQPQLETELMFRQILS